MENSQANDLVLQNASRELGLRRFKFTTAGLVFVFALGNTFLPSMFCDTETEMMYIPLSFFGICVTQIVLLGIYATFGTLAIKHRFPLTFGLAIFLAMSYALGLRISDVTIPGEAALMLIPFAILVCLAISGGMRLMRWQTGMHLRIPSNYPAEIRHGTKQVSVGYLMGAITFAAFAFAGVMYLVPLANFDFRVPPWAEPIRNCLFFAFAFNAIAFAAVFLVFAQKRVFALILLILLTLLLPWLQLSIVGWRFFSVLGAQVSYGFFLGYEISLLLALYSVRCSGVSLMFESHGQQK